MDSDWGKRSGGARGSHKRKQRVALAGDQTAFEGRDEEDRAAGGRRVQVEEGEEDGGSAEERFMCVCVDGSEGGMQRETVGPIIDGTLLG